MAKKLSTQEILAAARKQAGKPPGAEGQPAAAPPTTPGANGDEAEQSVAEEPSEAPAPPTAAPAAKPAGAPKSTKDILAAARAQAAGKAAGGAPSAPAAETATDNPGAGAKPAGGTKSTKDILAAARAQAGSGAKPAASTAPTAPKAPAAKASPKAAPAAKPDGAKPSVQEMLKAVRERKKPETAVAGPAALKTPKKPVPAVKPAARDEKTDRRGFLAATVAAVATPFVIAWTSLAAASVAALLGTARFMFPNVLVEPPSQFKIGPPSDYPFGTVSTKWTQQFAVWIVHTNYRGKNLVYALSTVCTHLGCTPNWLDGEQKFKCPCHGSGFYITGVNFEGPAPRPLERVGIRLAPDGMLEVDKSMKFQEELGQWQDANSFVEIV